MKISHKNVNSTLYVGLYGELDDHASEDVRVRLDALMCNDNVKKVVLDLSAVAFMDSTGIGVLIGRYKKLKERGVPLLLSSPSKAVDKVLSLSGLYEIMPKIIY